EPMTAEAESTAEVPAPNPESQIPNPELGIPNPESLTSAEPEREAEAPAPGPWPPAPEQGPRPPAAPILWLLSLFTPAAGDTVDWGRGNYTVLTRGGRVESAAGSGELKKQLQMVAEGSVLYASSVPTGSAPDVAPDGFAHPVFRAGFALSIP